MRCLKLIEKKTLANRIKLVSTCRIDARRKVTLLKLVSFRTQSKTWMKLRRVFNKKNTIEKVFNVHYSFSTNRIHRVSHMWVLLIQHFVHIFSFDSIETKMLHFEPISLLLNGHSREFCALNFIELPTICGSILDQVFSVHVVTNKSNFRIEKSFSFSKYGWTVLFHWSFHGLRSRIQPNWSI